MADSPNVLYIHTHDTGRYIQPYGYALQTPRLQRLAEEGTLFRHAFNAAPTCSPSRAALLTGMCAHSSGMLGLAHRGFSLNDTSQHLASFLGANGFETALCGVQHEFTWKAKPDIYERHIEAPDFDGDALMASLEREDLTRSERHGQHAMARDKAHARAAAAYLRQPKDKPFFLSFGMSSTHREFPKPAPDINPDFVRPPEPMHDNPRTREDMAAYATLVRGVDECVGIVLDALREAGLDDDTFVFFTTDHGIAFPKMKCHLYDTGIGISLILKFPGNRSAGKAIDALVSHVDMYPTLCEVAGLEKPDWLQGRSLLPLLAGDTPSIRDEVFSEVTYHASYEPMRCVRTERYKYIRYYDDYAKHVLPNIDDSYSKQFLMDHGLREGEHDPAEMLFDLYTDPAERVNLVDHPRYRDVLTDMKTRLESWMRDTDDPLLAGPVPKPEGAKVNTKTSIQPYENDWED